MPDFALPLSLRRLPQGGLGEATTQHDPMTHRRRYSVASTLIDATEASEGKRPWGSKGAVSVKVLLVVVACVFTAVPAVVWWWVPSQATAAAVSAIYTQGKASLELQVASLRSRQVLSIVHGALAEYVAPAEFAVTYCRSRLGAVGVGVGVQSPLLQSWSTPEALQALPELFARAVEMYHLVNASAHISDATFLVLSELSPNSTDGLIQQWVSYLRSDFDMLRQAFAENWFLSTSTLNAFHNASTLVATSLTDGGSWTYELPLAPTYPRSLLVSEVTSWESNLAFDPITGVPKVMLSSYVPLPDHLGAVGYEFATTIYSVSQLLLRSLASPSDRAFLFFHDPHGVVLAASHGKYFSHSDVDWADNDPFTNPPPLAEFRTFTPVECTDAAVRAAGAWLLENRFGGSWAAARACDADAELLGTQYWVNVAIITSELGLNVVVTLLLDKAYRTSAVEGRWAAAQARIHAATAASAAVFAVVAVGSVLLALAIALALTRPLRRLLRVMESLAALDVVDTNATTTTTSAAPRGGGSSRIREVCECEASLDTLERGTRAFCMYVPLEVAKLMVGAVVMMTRTHHHHHPTAAAASESPSPPLPLLWEVDLLQRRVVTLLCADVVAFTAVCEALRPERLLPLLSAYFTAACGVIAESLGTLDKFVGDCILAFWNAPRRVPHHEAVACEAVLEIQARLLKLHDSWREAALPLLKFRAGVHTGDVLVGNMGCPFRINYTCLGASVTAASALESLNKRYGTVVLVSQNTQRGAARHVRFRQLNLPAEGSSGGVVFEPLFTQAAMRLAPQEEKATTTTITTTTTVVATAVQAHHPLRVMSQSLEDTTTAAAAAAAAVAAVDPQREEPARSSVGQSPSDIDLGTSPRASTAALLRPEPTSPITSRTNASDAHPTSRGDEVRLPLIAYHWVLVQPQCVRDFAAAYHRALEACHAQQWEHARQLVEEAMQLANIASVPPLECCQLLWQQCNAHLTREEGR